MKNLNRTLPIVSIIILNWNGKKDTMECLRSLKKTDYPKNKYEIIVVDNGSTDDSVKTIKRLFPDVKIKKNKKNLGFAQGNNIGAKIAKGNFLVFLNNDTTVEKNWLKPLANKILDNDVGACMPKIVYTSYHGKKKKIINTAGGGFTRFGFPYLIGEGEKKEKYNKSELIFWSSGCCLMIKKQLFFKLNGFDKNFVMYAEDFDLSWRVWNEGYKVMFVPDSVIYHKGGQTIRRLERSKYRKSKFGPKYYYFQNRNVIRAIKKNSPKRYLFFLLAFRFCINIIESIVLMFLKRNMEIPLAIIRGTFNGLKYKRKKIKHKSFPYPYILLAGTKSTIKELFKKTRKTCQNYLSQN